MDEPDQEYDRNLIYRSLVKDEKDVLGLVAYGLYKKNKVSHIDDYIKKHRRPPTDKDLIPFQQTCFKHIDLYTDKAIELSNEFGQKYLANYVEELSAEYERLYQRRINNLRPLSMGNIVSSYLGSILFALTVAVLVVIIIGYQFGLWGAIEFVARNVNRPTEIEHQANPVNQSNPSSENHTRPQP